MELLVDPEFESLVPPLTGEERSTLEQGLLREGCRDALVAWQPPGTDARPILLDGHHRFALCQEHGIPYQVALVDLPSRQAAIEWVVQNQLGRRNLPPYARAELALKLEPLIAAEAKRRQQEAGREKLSQNSAEAVDTRERLARAAGVSHDTLSKAKALAEKASDPVKARLRRGETTIHREYDRIREAARRREKQERKTAVPALPEDTARCRLMQGALEEAGQQIEDTSLDCIITDSPYAQSDLPLYSELGDFAARTLKPGGSLLAMVGQLYLPEVIERLEDQLRYRWTIAYLLRGPHSAVWPASVRQQWKPVLWFTNGKRTGGDRVSDVIAGSGRDKEHHEWGQSELGMAELVERFTDPGQTICDPFVGGGTTAVVAVKMNRLFIGIDVDPEAIRTTQQRVAEAISELAQAGTGDGADPRSR